MNFGSFAKQFHIRKGFVLFCIILLAVGFSLIYARNIYLRGGYEPVAGDILYQSLDEKMPFVAMIEGVTQSPLSHCGIVIYKDGEWMVLEAIGEVGYFPLHYWIQRGQDNWFSVYRLQGDYAGAANTAKLIKAAKQYEGRPYDYRFLEDDKHIYCSELIFKAFFDAFGTEPVAMQELKELNWKPFAEAIIEVEGSSKIPFDRKFISPEQLSRSRHFKKVFSKETD